MIERFHDSRDPDVLYFTAWTTAIAPNAVASYETPLVLAKLAVEMRPQDGTLQESLGAVYYRSGQFKKAKQHLTAAAEAPESADTCPAYIWYFLAMTNHGLGRHDEAQKWLAQATEFTEKALAESKASPNLLSWNRRLTLELLDAEAKALLDSDKTK